MRERLIALCRKNFELSIKMRWLKTISHETEKYRKLKDKSDRQLYVVNALLKRYFEIYGEDLLKKMGGD